MNSPIRNFPKRSIRATKTTDVVTPILSPSFVPFLTLSIFIAPTFCPTKVVIAVPKVKLGSIAKPSTLITTVDAAINTVPNVFVKFCTNIAATANKACVIPTGSPSFMRCLDSVPSNLNAFISRVSTSFILSILR